MYKNSFLNGSAYSLLFSAVPYVSIYLPIVLFCDFFCIFKLIEDPTFCKSERRNDGAGWSLQLQKFHLLQLRKFLKCEIGPANFPPSLHMYSWLLPAPDISVSLCLFSFCYCSFLFLFIFYFFYFFAAFRSFSVPLFSVLLCISVWSSHHCLSFSFYQCCASGSGIRCLFDPWIPVSKPIFLRA